MQSPTDSMPRGFGLLRTGPKAGTLNRRRSRRGQDLLDNLKAARLPSQRMPSQRMPSQQMNVASVHEPDMVFPSAMEWVARMAPAPGMTSPGPGAGGDGGRPAGTWLCFEQLGSKLPQSFRRRSFQERQRKAQLQSLMSRMANLSEFTVMVIRSARKHLMRNRAVNNWVAKMMKDNVLTNAIYASSQKEMVRGVMNWFFNAPLMRTVRDWSKSTRTDHRKLKARQDRIIAAKFAHQFVLAVDTDGDGGLSLCELKAAELEQTGAANSDFAKAAMWLQHNRHFQMYDQNCDGVIEEIELVPAMELFLNEHWKYEGVLW